MIPNRDWCLLVEALCRQVDTWPHGTYFQMEELALKSPDIQEQGEDIFSITGSDRLFSLEEIEDAEYEVIAYSESKGLFVEKNWDLGMRLYEHIGPDKEFVFDEIESMQLTYEPALTFGGQSEANYDGRMLKVGPMFEFSSEFTGRSVQMDSESKERLWELIKKAGVPSWGKSYYSCALDGWGWKLLIHFRNGKVFASEGSNAWPDTLGLFWEGLFELVGLKVSEAADEPSWLRSLVKTVHFIAAEKVAKANTSNLVFEKLASFIPLLEASEGYGELVADSSHEGTLDNPISIPYYKYSDVANDLEKEVYSFVVDHPEFGLTNYKEILKSAGIRLSIESMASVDVLTLDSQIVLALLVGAVRADRFFEGTYYELLESGTVLRWLKRLQTIDEKESE